MEKGNTFEINLARRLGMKGRFVILIAHASNVDTVGPDTIGGCTLKKPSAKPRGSSARSLCQSHWQHLSDGTRAPLPSDEHQASASNKKEKTASNHHANLGTGKG
jgi:hypothetical protein